MSLLLVFIVALPFAVMALLVWPCLLLAARTDAEMPPRFKGD